MISPNNKEKTVGTAEFEKLVNEIRAKGSPLGQSKRLQAAAQKHAEWMNKRKRLTHRGNFGSSISSRVREEGYIYDLVSENIAVGQKTVQQVFDSWRGSRGHLRNMVRPEFNEYGLARVGDFWCLVVAKGRKFGTSVQTTKAKNTREASMAAMRSALERIVVTGGCECDSYHGHTCLMCRVRSIAYEGLRVSSF